MDKATFITQLRKRRKLLLRAYLLHVGCFASTCTFAATHAVQVTVDSSLWIVLLTIPPVLLYTALVDRSCRRIDPAAPTVGWLKIAVFTIFLTPIESSLVLPLTNLWVARRILRSCEHERSSSPNAVSKGGTKSDRGG